MYNFLVKLNHPEVCGLLKIVIYFVNQLDLQYVTVPVKRDLIAQNKKKKVAHIISAFRLSL